MDINAVAGSILSSKGLTVFTFATTFITVSILWTVLKQIFFKNPNEPPVVFHWVPIIGSTVTYGIDPYKFYFACQAKVNIHLCDEAPREAYCCHSMGMSSPSFYLEGRSRSTWGPKAINSYSMGS